MKYLFFDIECANCFNGVAKICEFGYVLTDENFNVIQKEIFLINPNDEFDWYVAKKLLNYSVNSYRRSPIYTHYYKKIKALITDDDVMIFGHTVDSDFKFLNDEARRYSLSFFSCKFYDAKYMYDTYARTTSEGGDNNSLSVSKICVALGIELPENVHKSVDDAYATMLIVKELTKRMNVDVNGLIELCPDCNGETADGVIKTVITERARLKREATAKSNYMKGVNKCRFFRFLGGVRPQGPIRINELTGKKICFSLNYERDHFKQLLSLVQLLKNCGCTYRRGTAIDYFVSYAACDEDGNETICQRESAVRSANEEGANIKIITLSELLKILSVTDDELNAMPFPDESSFAKSRVSGKNFRNGNNTSCKG